jgi:hypothetical protein
MRKKVELTLIKIIYYVSIELIILFYYHNLYTYDINQLK